MQTACKDFPNKSIPVSKCSDTYGDLLPLVGLQNPDPTALPVTCVLQGKLWPGFLRLTIAHVENSNVVSLTHSNTTVAGDGVVSAAAVPLARVDLKVPDEAPVKDEGASLVVFIPPVDRRISKYGNI